MTDFVSHCGEKQDCGGGCGFGFECVSLNLEGMGLEVGQDAEAFLALKEYFDKVLK